MSEVIQSIRDFIGADPAKNRSAWFVSNAVNGDHSVRQVNTYIEGWTVYTVSPAESLKMKHLERNNKASYIWVENQGEQRRKNVWMKGTVDVITDPAEINDLLTRRAAAFGAPHRYEARQFERQIIRFKPTYLRAESFVSHESGTPPFVMKAADFIEVPA